MGGSTRDAPKSHPSSGESDADSLEGAQSIGAYLSAQRRLRGISIEALSQQTRIPLRSLERLESGSFDADVDGFVRGFVRTVALALGLDADEALNRARQEPSDAAPARVAPRLSIKRVLVTVLGIALLGGVGFAVQLIAISVADSGRGRVSQPVVVRRDPVRSLAEAQGVAGLATARASLERASGPAAREAEVATASELVPTVEAPPAAPHPGS